MITRAEREIYGKVAQDTGLSVEMVGKIYKAYWRAVREHISSLPLKDNLADEEFLKLQPNINIPSIGKLYVTLDRYRKMRKVFSNNNNKQDNNVAH